MNIIQLLFYKYRVCDADVSEDDLCTAAKVPAFDFSLGPGFPPFEVSQLVFLKDLSCLLINGIHPPEMI